MKIMHVSSVEHPCFSHLMNEQRKNHELIFTKLDLIDGDKPCRIVYDEKNSSIVRIKNVKKVCDQKYDEKLRKIFILLFKEYKPHIVHIHVFSGISLLPILNAASSFGVKKILTLHDHSLFCLKGICYNGINKCAVASIDDCDCRECLVFSSENGMLPASYSKERKLWVQNIIGQSDKIICPSYHQKEQLIRLFGKASKFVALHYGVNLPSPSFVAKHASKPVFGYLGTLAWMKGISFIETAVNKLKKCDFEVLMGLKCDLSNPSDKDRLKRLSKYSKIKLKMNICTKNLYEEFFSQIDYLIIPSLWDETGPMTMFESFYYNVPVIISNNQSIVEKIGGGKGSKVFNNAEELTRIMDGVINGRIKRTKKDGFRVKGIAQYAKEVESFYREAMPRKKGGLFLKLGYRCNSNCIFCVTGDNYPREFIDFGIIRETLEKNRENYDLLVLTGGEPTIRKDFFDILELAYRLGYKILLQTNARMFSYEAFCEKLKNYNLKFMINVNGCNAAIHDATTNVKGSFEQTIRGIKNLQKRGFEVLCKVMLTKVNYRHLLNTVKYISQLGVKDIWLVFLTPYGSAKLNFDAVVPRYSDVIPTVNQSLLWLKNKEEVKAGLEGFPHCCVSQEFRSLVTEENFSDESLDGIYPEKKSGKYNCKRERVFSQKQRIPECQDCGYNDKCEGIYKEYIKNMGRREFKAIK